ncbi:MAG: hypothetical protein LBS18_06070 [Clostridiales bacterium]|jgi:hypothetical protein|nr:hypothetical protein [Clostridiales bacterium]
MSGRVALGPGNTVVFDIVCEKGNLQFTPPSDSVTVITPGIYCVGYSIKEVCGPGNVAIAVNGVPVSGSISFASRNCVNWDGTLTLKEKDVVTLQNLDNPITACCVSLRLQLLP